MKRYFFDYTANGQSLYDYEGDEFLCSKHALEFAEATVQSLKNSLDGVWQGWSVEVRNVEGRKLFSLPVDLTAPIAA